MLWLFLGYFNTFYEILLLWSVLLVCFEPLFHIKQQEKMQDLLKTQRTHKKGVQNLLHTIFMWTSDCLSLGRHSYMSYFLFSHQLICPQGIALVLRQKHPSWLRKLHLPLQISSFQRDEASWAEFLLLSLVITEEKHAKHFRHSLEIPILLFLRIILAPQCFFLA